MLHVDDNNHGPWYITGLGEYHGGELLVYDNRDETARLLEHLAKKNHWYYKVMMLEFLQHLRERGWCPQCNCIFMQNLGFSVVTVDHELAEKVFAAIVDHGRPLITNCVVAPAQQRRQS